MLLPVTKIVRGSDTEAAGLAIERRVQADISAIWRLDDSRILATSRPLPRSPDVVFGVEHRLGVDREPDAVVADGETNARRAVIRSDIVLAPKEEVHAAIPHDCGRIEHVLRRPRYGCVENRAVEVRLRLLA
jgi:hypothetical protein